MALLSRDKKRTSRGGSSGAGKAGKARKDKPPRGARLKQVRAAWTMTRRADPKLLPLTLAAFFGPLLFVLALGLAFDLPLWFWIPTALMVALLATTIVFGRRVQKAAFAGVEGQPGAAAAVLNAMRGDWRVTPGVGVNRDQELVHRVLGRPGIVLVAEAGPSGVHRGTRNLIGNEKKRLARVVGETPVYEVLVGDADGQVPLRQLEKHFAKLPRNLKPKRVNELDAMLKALPSNPLPIPKGPMPKSARVPRGKVR